MGPEMPWLTFVENDNEKSFICELCRVLQDVTPDRNKNRLCFRESSNSTEQRHECDKDRDGSRGVEDIHIYRRKHTSTLPLALL